MRAYRGPVKLLSLGREQMLGQRGAYKHQSQKAHWQWHPQGPGQPSTPRKTPPKQTQQYTAHILPGPAAAPAWQVPTSASLHAATKQQTDAGCHLFFFTALCPSWSSLCHLAPLSRTLPVPRSITAAGSLGHPAFPWLVLCSGHEGSNHYDATGLAAPHCPMYPCSQPRATPYCPTYPCSQPRATPYCPTGPCSQPRAAPYCPTCPCSQPPGDAGNGAAP